MVRDVRKNRFEASDLSRCPSRSAGPTSPPVSPYYSLAWASILPSSTSHFIILDFFICEQIFSHFFRFSDFLEYCSDRAENLSEWFLMNFIISNFFQVSTFFFIIWIIIFQFSLIFLRSSLETEIERFRASWNAGFPVEYLFLWYSSLVRWAFIKKAQTARCINFGFWSLNSFPSSKLLRMSENIIRYL